VHELSWSYDDIEKNWLAGGRLAVPKEKIVEAFNRAEELLGADWIGSNYAPGGAKVLGPGPTLDVVTVGQHLQALDNVPRSDRLLSAILRGDRYSLAELEALYLLRDNHEDFQAEMYPPVPDGEADLRIRWDDDPWLYVEVTQPDYSEDERRIREKTKVLGELVERLGGSFALEILMRREPTEGELLEIKDLLPRFCRLNPPQRADLPNGLGLLLLGRSQPGRYKFMGFPDEDPGSGLFELRANFASKTSSRHIAILLAFADDRAEAVLRREPGSFRDMNQGWSWQI